MEEQLRLAAEAVARGGVIAYPTEAVWGVGCDPFSEAAVERLLELKQRPRDKGLILIAGDWQQLDFLLQGLSAEQMQQLKQTWPGPNTWLVPHHGRVPEWLCGRFDSIALRITAHPPVISLCEAAGGPLVSTSANTAGEAPALEMAQVQRYFGDRLDFILPGPLGGAAAPSRIRDLVTGEEIRAG